MRIILSSSSCDRLPREAVDAYLRTGILPPARPANVEAKFNPYHDRWGRFASGPGGGGAGDGGGESGRWGDPGFHKGGGGTFDGGGASGSWPAPSPRPNTTSPRKPPAGAAATRPAAAAMSVARAGSATGHSVERNGYTYQLDAKDRTTRVTGTLTLSTDTKRSRAAQANAGGADRLPTDDGGHYIATRFNGPTDAFNHFAQNATFNRGGYRVLEQSWAADVKQGRKVYVSITPAYNGASKRPSNINVVYTVDGEISSQSFTNSSKGTTRGK